MVRHGDRQVAWAVDSLDGEREVVVKDLGAFIGRLPVVSGATIDGDGSVVCLVDLRELSESAGVAAASSYPRAHGRRCAGRRGPDRPPDEPDVDSGDRDATGPRANRPRVLVVEDSVGVRELERAILEGAGYEVITAVDGTEGAARLGGDPADLVLSDVEMPGMDGYALTRTIRRTRGLGARAGRDHDQPGQRGRPAGRPRCRRECLPVEDRVRPGPARRDGAPPRRAVTNEETPCQPW